jgi:hypothetical protein
VQAAHQAVLTNQCLVLRHLGSVAKPSAWILHEA